MLGLKFNENKQEEIKVLNALILNNIVVDEKYTSV